MQMDHKPINFLDIPLPEGEDPAHAYSQQNRNEEMFHMPPLPPYPPFMPLPLLPPPPPPQFLPPPPPQFFFFFGLGSPVGEVQFAFMYPGYQPEARTHLLK